MNGPTTIEEAIEMIRRASLILPNKQEMVIHVGNARAIDQCARWVFAAKGYEGDLNRGILLRGPKGTGKTHLMRCLSHLLQPYGFQVKKCDDIVKEFNDSTRVSSKQETRTVGGDHIIDKYAAVPRICFDDLADERQGKYFGEPCNVMERILSKRADLMTSQPLLTMFTTNVDTAKIEEKYGERVRDRMSLMARAFVVDVNPDPDAQQFRQVANVLDWRKPPEPPKVEQVADPKITALIEQLSNEKNDRMKRKIEEDAQRKANYLGEFLQRVRGMDLSALMVAANHELYSEAKDMARQEFDRRAPITLAEVERKAHEATEQKQARA